MRFLGSYARHDGKTPSIRPGTTNTDFADSDRVAARVSGPAEVWIVVEVGYGP